MQQKFIELLTKWRKGSDAHAGITEVFLAALGTEGEAGFQVELGFGDTTTMSFQAKHLEDALYKAHNWAQCEFGV